MKQHPSSHPVLPYLFMGSTTLAIVGFWLEPSQLLPRPAKPQTCQTIVRPESRLSRQQLAQLLTVPERTPKSRIRQMIQSPYCELPNLDSRTSAMTDREAYPLAFDRSTWLIVLYEGNTYAGYTFSFHL